MQIIVFLGILLINSQANPLLQNGWSFWHHGRQCVTDKDCGLDIRCEEGYCVCPSFNSTRITTYDKIQKSCARLVGSSCVSQGQQFRCVSNAECDIERQVCECNAHDFSPTSFGECRLNYGVACGNGKPSCNPEKFFRCNVEWGKCTCANDDEQIYIAESGSCFARPVERCELLEFGISPPCVKNSICVPNSEDLDFGICKCVNGFEVSDSSSCMPLHGSPCDGTLGCHNAKHLQCSKMSEGIEVCICEEGAIFNETSIECVPTLSELLIEVIRSPKVEKDISCPSNAVLENGTCKCLENSQFDTNLHLCRVRTGYPCEDDKSDICVRHAVCENAFCQCTDYHKATLKGECQLLFGANCIANSSVIDFTACHEDSLLKCQHEVCGCSESEVFDDMSQGCVQATFSLCDSTSFKCIDNAECVIVNGTTGCTCVSGFEETKDGRCEKSSVYFPSKNSGFLYYSTVEVVILNCILISNFYDLIQ